MFPSRETTTERKVVVLVAMEVASEEIHDREQNNLSVQNDDDISGNANQGMNFVNDDGNKETRLEQHQTPVDRL